MYVVWSCAVVVGLLGLWIHMVIRVIRVISDWARAVRRCVVSCRHATTLWECSAHSSCGTSAPVNCCTRYGTYRYSFRWSADSWSFARYLISDTHVGSCSRMFVPCIGMFVLCIRIVALYCRVRWSRRFLSPVPPSIETLWRLRAWPLAHRTVNGDLCAPCFPKWCTCYACLR